MQATRDPSVTRPAPEVRFTVHYPTWIVVASWLGVVVLVPAILMFVVLGLEALRAHAWRTCGIALLLAASPSYQLFRSGSAILTLHKRWEVTAAGVSVPHWKRAARFVAWREFGAIRQYPFASVWRYFDVEGNALFALFSNAVNGSKLYQLLQAAGSQHAMCVGAGLPDAQDVPHPPGLALAERLVNDLRAAGFAFSLPNNWRDIGWSSLCETPQCALTLAIAKVDGSGWLLHLVPMTNEVRPTIANPLPLACGRQLAYAAAQVAHVTLISIFPSMHWAVDGDPSDSAEPRPIAPTD